MNKITHGGKVGDIKDIDKLRRLRDNSRRMKTKIEYFKYEFQYNNSDIKV